MNEIVSTMVIEQKLVLLLSIPLIKKFFSEHLLSMKFIIIVIQLDIAVHININIILINNSNKTIDKDRNFSSISLPFSLQQLLPTRTLLFPMMA